VRPPRFAPLPGGGLTAWVQDCIREQELFAPGDQVLAAVSGGPDSTALLHLLYRLREVFSLRLGVAHFDHGLRGGDSRDDAAFVRNQADCLQLPFFFGTGDVRAVARERRISLQMAARRLRLAFFRQTCRTHGYGKLALGHTADDQVELFFLRLLRGAGPDGLKGMWPAGPDGLVRPLLAVGKAALLAWLRREGLAFREDLSNRDLRYLRNRVRLSLLPELAAAYNPRLSEAVWRLMALLQEDERLLAAATRDALDNVSRHVTPELVALDLPALFNLPPALQNRTLRALGETFCEDQGLTSSQVAALQDLARAGRSGGDIPLGAGRASRAGHELHFRRDFPPSTAAAVLLEPAAAGQTELPPGWRLTWKQTAPEPTPPMPADALVRLDAGRLSPPLTARYVRPGDRFGPAGAPGIRKLQDVFTDRKVPRWLRPHLPLVASGGGIVWAAGLGAAPALRLNPQTSQVLELSLECMNPETRRIWDMLSAWQAGSRARS
jgi:tRNA(Ile)-lysidine synthase